MDTTFTAAVDATSDLASWYLLDALDRVIDVCPEWDRVALAGQARNGVLRGAVIGRPLASFITGDIPRMMLDAALQATRLTGRTRRLPYRCDAPEQVRRLEMALVPLSEGRLRVEHRLLSVSPRHGPLLFSAAAAEWKPSLWRCSLCLRLRPAGTTDWIPSEDQPAGQHRVHYTVCPECSRQLREPMAEQATPT